MHLDHNSTAHLLHLAWTSATHAAAAAAAAAAAHLHRVDHALVQQLDQRPQLWRLPICAAPCVRRLALRQRSGCGLRVALGRGRHAVDDSLRLAQNEAHALRAALQVLVLWYSRGQAQRASGEEHTDSIPYSVAIGGSPHRRPCSPTWKTAPIQAHTCLYCAGASECVNAAATATPGQQLQAPTTTTTHT
jgi:hypothetical protein